MKSNKMRGSFQPCLPPINPISVIIITITNGIEIHSLVVTQEIRIFQIKCLPITLMSGK